MARTLTLLGDSIFDNAAYVDTGQADVTAHLERRLALMPKRGRQDWRLNMRAVDGAVVRSVSAQLEQASSDGRDGMIVLSVGGNDALEYLPMMAGTSANQTYPDLLRFLWQVRTEFQSRYADLLDSILRREQPLVVCTIYNPQFPDANLQKVAEAGLSFYNDAITQEALRRNLGIIDLRNECADGEDFANPIEPSERGGAKIADAIMRKLPA